MKRAFGLVVIALIILAAVVGNLTYRQGVEDGKILGKFEANLRTQPTFLPNQDLYSAEYDDCDDFERELAAEIIKGIKTADIQFEFEKNGDIASGNISIYYERQ